MSIYELKYGLNKLDLKVLSEEDINKIVSAVKSKKTCINIYSGRD